MAKPMMLIWMMIGVLIMSKAVSRMLCWSKAADHIQLSVGVRMHKPCCVTVCPSDCTWQAGADTCVFVVCATQVTVANALCDEAYA